MKPHSSNPLPALLRYFRQKAGLTQQDVAAALSISRSGYANYEEGRNIPNIEQAIKLSELLNHDFLYAYTLSSRYMQGHPKPLQIVMEDNSYMTAIESNQSTADMRQYIFICAISFRRKGSWVLLCRKWILPHG